VGGKIQYWHDVANKTMTANRSMNNGNEMAETDATKSVGGVWTAAHNGDNDHNREIKSI